MGGATLLVKSSVESLHSVVCPGRFHFHVGVVVVCLSWEHRSNAVKPRWQEVVWQTFNISVVWSICCDLKPSFVLPPERQTQVLSIDNVLTFNSVSVVDCKTNVLGLSPNYFPFHETGSRKQAQLEILHAQRVGKAVQNRRRIPQAQMWGLPFWVKCRNKMTMLFSEWRLVHWFN